MPEPARRFFLEQSSIAKVQAALCYPDARGAWLLSFVEVKLSDPHLFGSWVAVRLDLDGKELARSQPARFHLSSTPKALFSHDWDGDGVPEFGLPDEIESLDVPGGIDPILRLMHYKDGKVRLFPGTETLEIQDVLDGGLPDVDRDGRRDLLYTGPFRWTNTSPRYFFPSPMMVAHALPGGSFSTTDEIARRGSFQESHNNRSSCEPPPSEPESDGCYSALEFALSARCYALLKQPARAVAVAARCKFESDCGLCGVARRWARAPSPFPAASAPPAPLP